MPQAKNDWQLLDSDEPVNNWLELERDDPVTPATPTGPRASRDWSAFQEGSNSTRDWSAFGGPAAAPRPEPQPVSFIGRFFHNLPDVVMDVTQSGIDAAAAGARGVGVLARSALGPSQGSLTSREEYERERQQIAADADQVQRDLAQTVPGQAALRVEAGLSDIAEGALSLTSRAFGSGRMSETIHRDKAAREEFLAAAEAGGDVEKFIGKTGSRIFNNVVRSTAKMAAGGTITGGQAGILSLIAGETFDQKLAEREAKGGGGLGDVSDAINAATIETGLTYLFGQYAKRLGIESLEESVLSPALRKAAAQMATKAVPQSLRERTSKALAGAGLEWSEENVVDLANQALGLWSGDRQSLDWTQAFEAGLTGGASRAAVGSVKEIANRLQRIPAQTIQETVEGVVAAEQALRAAERPVADPAAGEVDSAPAESEAPPVSPAVAGTRAAIGAAESAARGAGAPGRGARGAKRFVENATPELLTAARAAKTAREFQAATGIKATSALFRRAFQDTLNLYASTNPPAGPSGQSAAAADAAPTPPVTVDPSIAGGSVQASGPLTAAQGEPAGLGTASEPPTAPTQPAAPSGPTAGVSNQATPGNSLLSAAADQLAGAVQRFTDLDLPRRARAARDWLKANFSSAGLRNPVIDQANDERLGAVAAQLMQAEQLRADFDRAVDAAYGGRGKLTPDQVRQLDAALKGKPATGIPAEVLAAIEPMRAHVDALSRKLLADGVVDPDSELGLTIEANEGSYLTRTYRKYGEKNWTDRVRKNTAMLDRARDWLKSQYPGESPDVTEWRLNVLLDKDSAAASPPAGVAKADRDFASVLRKRQALPDVVRELYGEYRDPYVNYTKSIAKMANLLAHRQFIADVRSAGLATGFLSDPNSPRPDHYRQIDATRTPRLAELSGLYTDPLTAKALQDLFSPEFHSNWYRALVKASGYAKWAQTVANSKTHVRNFVGNIVFAMSNGDLLSSGWRDAAKMTIDNLLHRGDDSARDYLRRLAELRLTDANVDLGDIRSMAAEMIDVDSAPRDGAWAQLAGKLADTTAGLSRVYQAQDTFWKVLAFENKKSQYARAYPVASFAEVEKLAAEDVRAHYPTYDKVPTAVRRLGHFPLIAPFVNFHSEVIRTLKNSLVTIARDIKSENPVLQEMAKQRAVGLASSFALVPAIAAISRAIVGVSDDEESDLREFLPSWSQNSQLLHLGKDGAGNYDAVDLSFLDARGIIAKPLLGLIRDGDIGERVDRAATELVAPLGEDLLFGRVMSAWRNQTPDGRPVYNEAADVATKAQQLSQYLGAPLIPGTFAQFERIRAGVAGEVSRGGKPYDALLETAALFGLRVSSTDTKQAFNFRSMDAASALNQAERGILQVASNRGSVTPGQIAKAYASYNRQREKMVYQWHEMAMAAIRLGVPEAEVRLQVATIAGERDAAMILGGRYLPYLPSENALRTIVSRPDGPARVQKLISLHREAIEQQESTNTR